MNSGELTSLQLPHGRLRLPAFLPDLRGLTPDVYSLAAAR